MSADLARLAGRPVIVGGGLAGLATALFLSPEPVALIARAPLGTGASSPLAQGGMAASLGADDDAGLHLADTLAAGDGLCDPEAARRILAEAPAAIAALERFGVAFDAEGGRPALGLEAAHSRRRIVHADGDGTGREVVRALAAAVRQTPSITLLEGVEVRRLLVEDGAVAGVLAVRGCEAVVLPTGRVVLATGGVGGLFEDTTNPPESFGQGLALAARAGAVLSDLEFVQFHPTALAAPARPLPLVSEAVRGEGAILVNEKGERFLAHVPGAELAPRDVVARAVWRERARGGAVFLDARAALGTGFAARFPGIAAACRVAGFDPAAGLVPIRTAAHYHMGGIRVDGEGRSSVPGLWACGEVAATGLHGANRLASNSLTEAAVCARAVAESLAATPALSRAPRHVHEMPPPPDPAPVRALVSNAAGVERDGARLRHAARQLLPLAAGGGPASDPALAGLMLVLSALEREESRGGHFRTDFPDRAPAAARSAVTLERALAAAAGLAEAPVRRARGV